MPRQRTSRKRVSEVRDTSLIVIATEGEKTERAYFEFLKDKWHCSRIKLKILDGRKSGQSSPEHVLGELNDCVSAAVQGAEPDHLCMIIDRDRWNSKMLSAVAQECNKKEYMLAVSSPCFEFWLLLHLVDLENMDTADKDTLTKNKKATKNKHSKTFLKKELSRLLGSFNPSKPDFAPLWPHTRTAIEQAKNLDNPEERYPTDLGSRVYKVLELIDKLCGTVQGLDQAVESHRPIG